MPRLKTHVDARRRFRSLPSPLVFLGRRLGLQRVTLLSRIVRRRRYGRAAHNARARVYTLHMTGSVGQRACGTRVRKPDAGGQWRRND